ncbi:MAG: hypothetical protein ACRCY8_07345 [Dermatophilaceae bacterium]
MSPVSPRCPGRASGSTRREAGGRHPRTAVVALAAALALGGCSAARDALVGIEPAPRELTASAPLDTEGATAIASRVLADAEAAATQPGDAGKKARAAVLAGDALRAADAAAARAPGEEPPPQLAKPEPPVVVAQSQGRDWPRAVLASTLDRESATQYLHVLVSDDPQSPYRIRASVPMFPGATLPAIGGRNEGAALAPLATTDGVAVAPATAIAQYAAALRYPKPGPTGQVSIDDPFAAGMRAAAAENVRSLGALGTYAQTHAPALEDAVAFRLTRGGVVAFALLTRTDTATARPAAKELTLTDEWATAVGKARVTRSATVTTLEPVVVLVPPSGRASVIGATEVLVSGRGS